jgi:zeta-carotene desaturase
MATLAPVAPRETGETFLTWLHRHRQTEQAVERFWKPVLVSALNEELDRVSVPYAAQVVRESFLKSAAAGRMGVPTVPLTELYSVAGDYIAAHGGEIRLRCSVESFLTESDKVNLLVSGEKMSFDFVVFAVPFDVLSRMLPPDSLAEPLRQVLARFETSPITGIHLWFDRQITDLDHAVLLDRTIQWMFHKSNLLTGVPASRRHSSEAESGDRNISLSTNVEREGHDFSRATNPPIQERALAPEANSSYVELVVSASKTLVEKSRAEIIELALAELREFFPGARDANLVKSTVIKEVHATYSPRPGVDIYRPRPETVWPRVFLAGDWTATGWPATMEGAVRSGYLAAESMARVAGLRDASFLVPNLPASGLMRLFG